MAAKTDVFQSPDYYLLDELLTDPASPRER